MQILNPNYLICLLCLAQVQWWSFLTLIILFFFRQSRCPTCDQSGSTCIFFLVSESISFLMCSVIFETKGLRISSSCIIILIDSPVNSGIIEMNIKLESLITVRCRFWSQHCFILHLPTPLLTSRCLIWLYTAPVLSTTSPGWIFGVTSRDSCIDLCLQD